MIAQLTGVLVAKDIDHIVIDVQGVGYEVYVSDFCLGMLGSIGENLTLIIHTDVRENAITLYGFTSLQEKKSFAMLRKVKGIGSRIALAVLSTLDPAALMRAIGMSDASMLQKVPGVGRKSAERIIVELREQVLHLGQESSQKPLAARVEVSSDSLHIQDALLAMQQLGFPENDSRAAIDMAMKEGSAEEVGDLLKSALKFIGNVQP